VERLNRSGGKRPELEEHVSTKHGIGEEELRQQSLGLVMAFHQESHRVMQQDHSVTELHA
jgi:hypothetical protein